MCAPCVVIILCCGALGSSARALAKLLELNGGDKNLIVSLEAIASSNEELKEAFMLMYEHSTISISDMEIVAKLGGETLKFSEKIDANRWEPTEFWTDEKAKAFALECDALRWQGLNTFAEIAKRTPEYAGPGFAKKPKK